MVPVDAYGGCDFRSIEADNTSAFNCRYVDGTTRWSNHAYGRAIDVNPIENPYVSGGRDVARGESAVRRSHAATSRDGATRAARSSGRSTAIGWGWGGRWSSVQGLPALLRERPLTNAARFYRCARPSPADAMLSEKEGVSMTVAPRAEFSLRRCRRVLRPPSHDVLGRHGAVGSLRPRARVLRVPRRACASQASRTGAGWRERVRRLRASAGVVGAAVAGAVAAVVAVVTGRALDRPGSRRFSSERSGCVFLARRAPLARTRRGRGGALTAPPRSRGDERYATAGLRPATRYAQIAPPSTPPASGPTM